MNKLLSIAIPTKNRAELLRGCLESIIPQARARGITINISDNHSSDNTAEVVATMQRLYDGIVYSRVEECTGEANRVNALKMGAGEYVWTIGDRIRLVDGAIKNVLSILERESPDLLVVNSYSRPPDVMVKDIPSGIIFDSNCVLAALGWWITFMGASIWSRRMITDGKYEKYADEDYGSIGIIFDYLAEKGIVCWIADPLISAVGSSSWVDRTFEMSISNWTRVIDRLPTTYIYDARRKCLKDLGMKSKNFTLRGFLMLRSRGIYNLEVYKKHQQDFKYVTDVPDNVLFAIALMPSIPHFMIRNLKGVYDMLRPRTRT